MLRLWCCSNPRSASDWRTERRLEELKSAIGFFKGKWFWSDATKQAQEVIFSWKIKKSTHPPLVFNNAVISQTNSKKHLGVTLHLKLTIKEHLLNTFGKGDRIIGLLQKLQNVLPKITLVTIYKAFLWSRLDYEDILYDQVLNNIFHDRLESIHFYACLAITGAIRGTSTAWKVSNYGVFSGPYFPAFGLNTERYEVSLRIQSECGKIRTRKKSVFGHFWCSGPVRNYIKN